MTAKPALYDLVERIERRKNQPELISAREIAAMLNVSDQTVVNRLRKSGPEPIDHVVTLGKHPKPMYSRDDIDRWIKTQNWNLKKRGTNGV